MDSASRNSLRGWGERVDAWLPPHIDRRDSAAVRRARLVVLLSGAVGFYVPVFVAISWFGLAAPQTALGIGLVGASIPLAPWIQRWAGTWWAAQWLCGSLWATIAGIIFVNGGADSMMQSALSVVPVLAVAASSVRSGLGWTVVAMATVAVLELVGSLPAELSVAGRHGFFVAVALAMPPLLLSLTALFDSANRAAQEELRAQESRIRSILQAAPDAILVVDADATIRRANPAAEQLFAGKTLSGSSASALFAGLRLNQESSEPVSAEVVVAGSSVPVELTVAAMGDQFVAVIRDASSHLAAERAMDAAREAAEASSRAKSVFLATMSHELRTPLNAIIGYGELVDEELADEDSLGLRPDVERILLSGRHLLGLIDDILDLTKIEAGELQIRRERVVLHDLTQHALQTAMPSIMEAKNEVLVRIDVELDETIESDPVRLRQVLINLLSNAGKFTSEGTVELSVGREEVGGAAGVCFEVRDNGPGMTPEQVASVFQEFVQGDGSTTRRYGGAGLGLTICHRLLTVMGGHLVLDSTMGQGTVARVWVPSGV